ncbi:hypothetical protein INT45_011146 [Circinella minor]|uniref:MULE transposase domain-containing protein n=1 Tax=Circinella minor TaxID=1195481 RepID=A0A8H7VV75_9FUNG|nr:hypothetical protein INT45_011146 [Circinella minor]
MKLRDHGFVPAFMSSDKDKAQRKVIKTVWGCNPIRLRLCPWHFKRAIDKKLSGPISRNIPSYDVIMGSTFFPDFLNISTWTSGIGGRGDRRRPSCPGQDRETILSIVTKHFHMHSLIDVPGHRTPAQIYIGAAAWKTWARCTTGNCIPIAKTTMLIEAHWKVLKRNHLYHYNRARLVLLVALCQPSIETWTCGCPSLLTSRYMICKYFVRRSPHGRFGPNHFFIHRRITAPFIRILDYNEGGRKCWASSLSYSGKNSAVPPMLPDDSDDGNDDDSNNDNIIFGDHISITSPGTDQKVITPPLLDTSIVANREQNLLRREERVMNHHNKTYIPSIHE